jgi:hypothetical protein
LDDDTRQLDSYNLPRDAIIHVLFEPGFDIVVKTLIATSEFPLHVEKAWTVCQLRAELDRMWGRPRKSKAPKLPTQGLFPFDPIATCRLTFRGTALVHSATLHDLGLVEGAVVFALVPDRLPRLDATPCSVCGELLSEVTSSAVSPAPPVQSEQPIAPVASQSVLPATLASW